MSSFVQTLKGSFTKRLKFYSGLSTKQLLLNVFFALQPSYLMVALLSFTNAGAAVLFTGFAMGLLFGLLFLMLVNHMSTSLLTPNKFIYKLCALNFPLAYLFAFASDNNSARLMVILFAAHYFLLLGAFIAPLVNIGRRVCAAVILFSAFYMMAYCVYSPDVFSPDSYTYFDMSRHIFGGFGQVDTVRQYVYDTDLAVTFPYFYPFLIAIVNSLTGLKVYSGVVVNVACSFFTCYILYKISNRYFKNSYAAALTAGFLMSNDTYLTEVKAARAVPLALALFLVALYCVLALPNITKRKALAAGIACGAAMVTKTDFAVFAIGIFVAVLAFSRKGNRAKNALCWLAGFAVLVLPWVIYSLINFGSFWISDTSTLWLLTLPATTARYYSPGVVQSNLFTAQDSWLTQLVDYKLAHVWEDGFIGSAGQLGLVALAVWVMLMVLNFTRGKPFVRFLKANAKLATISLIMLILCIIKFLVIWVNGFNYDFYHTETWAILIFFSAQLCYAVAAFRKDTKKIEALRQLAVNQKQQEVVEDVYCMNHKKASRSVVLNFGTAFVCGLLVLFSVLGSYQTAKASVINQVYITSGVYNYPAMAQTIKAQNPNAVMFFADQYDSSPFIFGPYTGIKTYAPPALSTGDTKAMNYLIDNYIQPDFIFSISAVQSGELISRYGLQAVGSPQGFYKVTNKTSYSAEKKLFDETSSDYF
ncbi:MAG: glycosyltransferase family 39 protein [Oscillospiraceae bacterium]|nr:glycosyltransferase family 39 protein [Oscillospiraceae bacterium]